VGLFRSIAADKNLRLRLHLAGDLPDWVEGDEIRLRQVVQNLVSNALKFTDAGEVAVAAELAARQDASCRLRIEVRDTGIGIPAESIGRLFCSFSQADSTISRRFGGTGLGLAISKRLVELMGGAIEVESQPGAGALFRFTVRLGLAAAAQPQLAAAPAGRDLETLRVLLAEDNPVNQMVALKRLRTLGISADLAENGAQAVEASARSDYDVILMDVQMPELDGIAATRAIRSRGGRQPFICGLSAHATTEFHEISRRAGMDAYLTKPLDFGKLHRLLVERAAQGAASMRAADVLPGVDGPGGVKHGLAG